MQKYDNRNCTIQDVAQKSKYYNRKERFLTFSIQFTHAFYANINLI